MGRCDVPRSECLNWHVKGYLRDPKPSGNAPGGIAASYRCLCPVHADTERSLSVSVGEKARIIWHCHADCNDLAVRAALVRDGVSADCLPVPKEDTQELVDAILSLYHKDLGHAEMRMRIYSLVNGLGGEAPARRAYPGGRRGFARDAGVSHSDVYGRSHNR